jgi:hypothetical protein
VYGWWVSHLGSTIENVCLSFVRLVEIFSKLAHEDATITLLCDMTDSRVHVVKAMDTHTALNTRIHIFQESQFKSSSLLVGSHFST